MRNTYDNKGQFGSKNTGYESKQRQNYTQNNPKQLSFQKNPQVSPNQKMSKFITQTLKKIASGSNKLIALTTLKPNQKTLLSVISLMLSQFDNQFDESFLQIDMLIQIFKLLGYPYNINKTVFQPVGAPHTWGQCLQMMYWLAELAGFHFDIRLHIQQINMEEDFNNVLIKAFIQNNQYIARNFLNNQTEKYHKMIEDLKFKISTNNMAMENIKNTQKDLFDMEQENKKQIDLLRRQNEQVIQIQQKNTQLQQNLAKLQQKLFMYKDTYEYNIKQITRLQQQIQHQQLSVQQVQQIRQQNKQLKQKISILKNNQTIQQQLHNSNNMQLISQFIQFNKILDSIGNLIRDNRQQIQKRNILFELPDIKLKQLQQLLNDKQKQGTIQQIKNILCIKQIYQLKQKQLKLHQIVTIQSNEVINSKNTYTQQNNILSQYNIQKQIQIQNITKQYKQSTLLYQNQQQQKTQLQNKYKQLLTSITILQSQISTKLTQRDKENHKLIQLSQQCKSIVQFKNIYEKNISENIKQLQQQKQQFQIGILMLLENMGENYLNMQEQIYQMAKTADIQFNNNSDSIIKQNQFNQLNNPYNTNQINQQLNIDNQINFNNLISQSQQYHHYQINQNNHQQVNNHINQNNINKNNQNNINKNNQNNININENSKMQIQIDEHHYKLINQIDKNVLQMQKYIQNQKNINNYNKSNNLNNNYYYNQNNQNNQNNLNNNNNNNNQILLNEQFIDRQIKSQNLHEIKKQQNKRQSQLLNFHNNQNIINQDEVQKPRFGFKNKNNTQILNQIYLTPQNDWTTPKKNINYKLQMENDWDI